MKEQIEFETVAGKVPKKIMAFLKAFGENPEKYLEHVIVERVRADVDAQVFSDPHSVAEVFGLNQVFRAIVDDEVP